MSTPDGKPLVRLHTISKSFSPTQTALDRLDLEIAEGEFLTLLGPSGCGKSTLLRLLAGLSTPSSGTIEWASGQRPDLGFVFQDATLMPWASALQNVWLPLRLKGVPFATARPQLEAALDMVGLSDFGLATPRELSGGMKMRVSIARALVKRPRVLLMDEPFAALDEMTRLKLSHDLLDLKHALGMTVVFVTHSVFESVFLSSRLVVLAARPGRIVQDILVPRDLKRDEAFRSSALYSDTCLAASAALRATMTAEDLL